MTRHAPEMTEAKNKSQRLFKLELGKLWAVAVVALVAVVAVFYETYARCYAATAPQCRAAVGLILATNFVCPSQKFAFELRWSTVSEHFAGSC